MNDLSTIPQVDEKILTELWSKNEEHRKTVLQRCEENIPESYPESLKSKKESYGAQLGVWACYGNLTLAGAFWYTVSLSVMVTDIKNWEPKLFFAKGGPTIHAVGGFSGVFAGEFYEDPRSIYEDDKSIITVKAGGAGPGGAEVELYNRKTKKLQATLYCASLALGRFSIRETGDWIS
jgi:hypothetical protein